MTPKYKKCPIAGCGGHPERLPDSTLRCVRCGFFCKDSDWNKLTRYEDMEWAGATHKALLESQEKWVRLAQRRLEALKTVTDIAKRRLRAIYREADERTAAELEATAYLEKWEALQEKIKEMVFSRRCSDHGCIWGHPGGMGTNGGCQSRKLNQYEARRELEKLAEELRTLLPEEKE